MKLDIRQFNPCNDVLAYYESKASFEEAWHGCERGDWMLWLAAHLGIDSRKLARAAALCANTVRHLMKDARYEKAVDDVLAYADGEIDGEKLRVRVRSLPAVHTVASSASYARTAAYIAANTPLQKTGNAMQIHFFTFLTLYTACAASAAYEQRTVTEPGHAVSPVVRNTRSDSNRRQTADICREVLTEAVFEEVKRLTP